MPRLTRIVVFGVWLLFSVGSGARAVAQEPEAGSGMLQGLRPEPWVTGVEFDAVIELRSRWANRWLTLYMRYTVTPDSYGAEIIWCEPNWGTKNFACYPITLGVASSSERFAYEIQRFEEGEQFGRPVGERPPFGHMFNSYPIGDIRYADAAARTFRVPAQRLSGPYLAPGTGVTLDEFSFEFDLSPTGLVDRLALFSEQGDEMKVLEYDYDDAAELRGVRATLPPLEIEAVPLGSADVTIDGDESSIELARLTHHQGGRHVDVTFNDVVLDGRTARMPTEIQVLDSRGGELLRRARLSGFELIAREEAHGIAGLSAFTDAEEQLARIARANWGKSSQEVPVDDRERIQGLLSAVEDGMRGDELPGMGLRIQHWQCLGNFLLGEDELTLRHLGTYFAMLRDQRDRAAYMMCGREFIRYSIRHGRPDLAARALDEWTQGLHDWVGEAEIIAWAQEWIEVSSFWTAYVVLRNLPVENLAPELRFRRSVAMARALQGLSGFAAEATPEECTGWGIFHPDWLDISLTEITMTAEQSTGQARVLFRELSQPSLK